MRFRHDLRFLLLLLLGLTLCPGCQRPSYDLAPVSGRITLNGQPLTDGHVVFQPITSEVTSKVSSPGPGSYGFCDGSGGFTLQTILGRPGAVIGAHRVFIRKITGGEKARPSSDDSAAADAGKELIPARYNDESVLRFDVPAEGTSTADFELTTVAAP